MDDCPYGNPSSVPDLIKQRYTNVKFNEAVNERHMDFCEGYRYFTDFFPTEVWQDGMGQDMITEEYYYPRINYSFSYFARSMQVCDQGDGADECFTQYCDIPKGGYGNLPGPEMYRWGFKTDPMCVANIRHVRDFKKWAKRIVDTRFAVDEQVMNMFYTFMAIRTSGHKVVLETDDNGDPLPSSDPRNPFGGFGYNYMDTDFPALTNPENLRPLTMDVLDILAERWHTFNRKGHVAMGPRNERVWEFWHPHDWYRQEILDNGDYIEKIKHTMPSHMFAGFKHADDGGEREIMGNWSMRQMPCLPRFNVSCDGDVVPIDAHTNVPVEIGHEPVEAREWINAPILLIISPSPTQGKILRRPDLTESAEGFPIMPIMGSGDWLIRNEYDKDCNPDRNMPWTQKRYEMGFMLTDPNAGISILSRAKRFRLRPASTCDLQPIGKVDPFVPDCGEVGIGCEDNKAYVKPGITKTAFGTKVLCAASVCFNDSNDGSDPYRYRVQLERKGIRPGFNQLDCACGSVVELVIHDANGDELRTQPGTIDEIVPHNILPIPYVYVGTETELVDGECIKAILCQDASPDSGNVSNWFVWSEELDCPEFDGAKYILDSPLTCNVGDDVTIEYLDVDGALIDPPGAITGTIADAQQEHLVYQVTSADEDAFVEPAGTVTIRITCVAE